MSDSPPGQLGDWCPEPDDFAFAFNDPNFSDRVLRIEIVPDIPEPKSDAESYAGVADWTRNRKRRRAESKRTSAEDILVHHEVQFLNCNIIDTDDVVLCENQDEEVVAMIESPSDSLQNPVTDEAARSNDLLWSMDCSTILKVETLHISSPILAAKSPFFYKLFSNGMKESEKRQTTLKIHASEEAALMDLLNFMYSNTLPITTAPSLLNVLKAADKFEVASCMRYCSSLLKEMPMTPDSALLYLDLPSCVLMADAVQKLTDKAKEFLAENYKDISKHADEVLNLPLSGIEVVLSSDLLQITSEDTAYDVVLKWARLHYPDVEARREVIGSRLANLIRFPYLSSRKLRKVLCCNDFDPQLASKIVLEALFFKSETPFRQRSLAAEKTNSSCRRFVERAYKYRPIKIVEFELPRPQCFVYLDLKRDECESMFPSGRVYSQAFYLCGQAFFLSAHCNLDQQGSFQCLGMFLGMQNKGADSFTVDYDFSVRAKPGKDFTSKYRGTYSFTGGKAVGYRNLLSMPWTTLMDEDCVYFIDSVLHLRADLTIKQ